MSEVKGCIVDVIMSGWGDGNRGVALTYVQMAE